VVVNGLVLAEDGRKMSKRLKNYPEPEKVLEKNGADALRFYFLSSGVVKGENLNFSPKDLSKANNLILTLFNIFTFYNLYRGDFKFQKEIPKSKYLLDRWLLSRINSLIAQMTKLMDAFDFPAVCRELSFFINDFSVWYLRRSRERLKEKRKESLAVFSYTLSELTKLLAPLLPFVSEKIYLDLTQGKIKESVHLEKWPKADKKLIDKKLEAKMVSARKICELGHSLRKKAGIKVRQPLAKLKIVPPAGEQRAKIKEELFNLLKDELNVKEIETVIVLPEGEKWLKIAESEIEIALNTEITPELKVEGMLREIARQISNLRKEARLTINDQVAVYFKTESKELKNMIENFKEELKEKTASKSVMEGEPEKVLIKKQFEINNEKIDLNLSK